MASLIAFVLVTIAAGYGLRKLGLVRQEAAKDLNALVFYLTLPMLVFMALHRATLSWSMLVMPLIAWGAIAVGLAIGFLIARAGRMTPTTAGAFVLALTFGNTTFFGYPVIQGLYGEAHLTLAIFYDQLGATLAVNTVGVAVASRMGTGSVDLASGLRRLALFPPIWGLVLGLALHGLMLPPLVAELLERLGQLTVPLIMLSIGLSLQFSRWREDLGWVAVATAGRLLVLPALVWGATRALGLPLAYQQAAVMEAAMPSMFFSLTVAMLFGLHVNLIVNAIMATTMLSFVTLPLWYMLLR